MNYQPKNILVTGGAGFIGSHFVDFMLSHNPAVNIINLDALTYAGKLENLVVANQFAQHQFVHGDINNKSLVHSLFADHHIDTVVHFAAESHVDRSIQNPDIFVQTNVLGTQVLLDAAREYWLKHKKWNAEQCRFHMISTDEVFGSLTADAPAFTEESLYQPRSPYSASKAAADHLVYAYHHTYQLPITLSHCSNNYGPRQDEEKLIPKVINACLQQKAIPVYGSGHNTRDWIYVGDHCKMVAWVIEHGKVGESYNLGAQNEWKNLALIQHICSIMDQLKPLKSSYSELIEFVADRAGHDYRYAINSNKALQQGCPPAETKLDTLLTQMIKMSPLF